MTKVLIIPPSFLLRTGASIEMTGGIQARTAISRHSIPILSKMYDFGWRPDHVSIICAVIENDDEILEWLIEHGAKPTNGAGLETAAERGTTRQIDILLAAGARLTDTNPLHMAAGSARVYPGRMEMMAHLVNVGCDVNAWDSALPAREQRGTALCYACRSGNVEAARWLLEHGADQSYKKFGKFLTIQGTELIRSPGVLQQLEALLDKYEDASEWTYDADEGVWRGSSWL